MALHGYVGSPCKFRLSTSTLKQQEPQHLHPSNHRTPTASTVTLSSFSQTSTLILRATLVGDEHYLTTKLITSPHTKSHNFNFTSPLHLNHHNSPIPLQNVPSPLPPNPPPPNQTPLSPHHNPHPPSSHHRPLHPPHPPPLPLPRPHPLQPLLLLPPLPARLHSLPRRRLLRHSLPVSRLVRRPRPRVPAPAPRRRRRETWAADSRAGRRAGPGGEEDRGRAGRVGRGG